MNDDPRGVPTARTCDSHVVSARRVGHSEDVVASAGTTLIPEARFHDLDLDREEDRVEWRRRLAELATARLAGARARFQQLGIIDARGKLISTELPPDMLPDSDTTLETG
jgi:phage terminase Nu1 subunit (DNA packaging protein)